MLLPLSAEERASWVTGFKENFPEQVTFECFLDRHAVHQLEKERVVERWFRQKEQHATFAARVEGAIDLCSHPGTHS